MHGFSSLGPSPVLPGVGCHIIELYLLLKALNSYKGYKSKTARLRQHYEATQFLNHRIFIINANDELIEFLSFQTLQYMTANLG